MNKKSDTPRSVSFEIPSDPRQIHVVERKLERFCQQSGFPPNDVENCAIAVTEMINNAIRHGNKGDVNKKVYAHFELNRNEMKITVMDEGCGFDPDNIGDPLHPDNLYKENGRGIFIVKTLMDDVSFEIMSKGTKVTMRKKLK